MLREVPILWFVFIIIALLDLTALSILYWAPSEPVSKFLAPVIRTFWGDRFLHYPANFLLLPKLLNHAHFLILMVFGVFLTGSVIKIIESQCQGTRMSVVATFGPVSKKFLQILMAWLIAYGVFTIASRLILPQLPGRLRVQLPAIFVLGIVSQALFAYLLPSILMNNNGFIKDVLAALKFGLVRLVPTMLLVVGPIALLSAIAYLKFLVPFIIGYYPELVLAVLVLGIAASLVADLFVTVVTTLYYIDSRRGS